MLPLIAAGTAAKVIYDMYQSDKLDSQAAEESLKAMNRVEEARAAQRRKQEEAKQSMLRLGNRKKGILASSMKKFIEVYEQLKKINFVKTDGIAELSGLPANLTEELSAQITFAGNPMTDAETVTTMVVNTIFWGLAGGISASIKKDSQRNLDMAQARAKQARAIEAQANTVSLAYDAITGRSDRITEVLTKLNFLFMKSLEKTQAIVAKNGMDKSNYTVPERESLAVCVNLAVAVKRIIDTPLLDPSGELTVQSLNAIEIGQQYLQEIHFEINK